MIVLEHNVLLVNGKKKIILLMEGPVFRYCALEKYQYRQF